MSWLLNSIASFFASTIMIYGPFSHVASSFSPTDIPNCAAWLDASQLGLSNNDDVTSWTDESGNGNNGTGVGYPEFLTNQVNGLPAIDFNGTSDYFTFSGFLDSATSGSVFVVLATDVDPSASYSTSANPIQHCGTTVDVGHYKWTDDSKIYDAFGTSSRKTVGTTSTNITSWHIYDVTSISGGWDARLNGERLYSTSSNTVGFNGSYDPVIGRNISEAYNYSGRLAEVIFYSSAVSESNRQLLLGSLSDKYNITINTGNPSFLGTPVYLGTARNDSDLEHGFKFTVGSNAITVTHVGRWVISGNSGSHTVTIYNSSGTSMGSASVNTSGATAGKYAYAALGTPIALSASTSYYILSSETNAGDQFYNYNTEVNAAPIDGTVDFAAYKSGTITDIGSAGNSYGPLNFRYYVP